MNACACGGGSLGVQYFEMEKKSGSKYWYENTMQNDMKEMSMEMARLFNYYLFGRTSREDIEAEVEHINTLMKDNGLIGTVANFVSGYYDDGMCNDCPYYDEYYDDDYYDDYYVTSAVKSKNETARAVKSEVVFGSYQGLYLIPDMNDPNEYSDLVHRLLTHCGAQLEPEIEAAANLYTIVPLHELNFDRPFDAVFENQRYEDAFVSMVRGLERDMKRMEEKSDLQSRERFRNRLLNVWQDAVFGTENSVYTSEEKMDLVLHWLNSEFDPELGPDIALTIELNANACMVEHMNERVWLGDGGNMKVQGLQFGFEIIPVDESADRDTELAVVVQIYSGEGLGEVVYVPIDQSNMFLHE